MSIMTTLSMERPKDRTSWLFRALDRNHTSPSDSAPTHEPSRAGNPTPHAGLHKLHPQPDAQLTAKKLVYLQKPNKDGKMHITRSNTHVDKTRQAMLLKLTHEIGGERWREAEEVRSAPDSATYAMKPWIQRQHTMLHLHDDNILPPLSKDYTYVRERSLYLDHFEERKPDLVPWGSRQSLRDLQRHWNIPPRPVRPDVETRIVSHLKKQYSKRMERRYQELLGDEDYDEDDEECGYYDDPRKQHQHVEDPHNMPGKWRHLPEVKDTRLVGSGGVRALSRPATREDGTKPTNRNALKSNAAVDKLPLSLARPKVSKESLQRFDYVGRYIGASPGDRHDQFSGANDETHDVTEFSTEERGNSGATNKSTHKVFDLTGLETREATQLPDDHSVGENVTEEEEENLEILLKSDEEREENYRDVLVSPVPTPWIFSRPQTARAMRSLSMEERMKMVVDDGHIHVRFKLNKRCPGLYIHSACKDTEVERSALAQYTYPPLKAYCKTQGFDLEVVDLHWGSSDLVLDSQDDASLAEKLIAKCHENGKGITFVTMIGQKSGQARVPTEITEEEFELIVAEMEFEKHHLVAEARRRWEEMEARLKAEEEERAQAEAEASRHASVSQDESEAGKGSPVKAKTSKASTKSKKSKPDRASKTPASLQLLVTAPSSHSNGSESPDMPASGPRESSRMDSWRKRASEVGVECIVIKGMKRQYKIPTDDLYPDPDLIRSWFTLDHNNVPPVYRLNLISSHFPDIIGKDGQKRKEARMHWATTSKRLLTQLYHYAQLAGLTQEELVKYSQSSMEKELACGVFYQQPSKRNQCVWLRREIQDISYSDGKAREYVDMKEKGSGVEHQAQEHLDTVKSALESAIPAENIFKFAVNWSPQGINPATSRYYASYIARLCKDAYNLLKTRLDAKMADERHSASLASPLHKETLDHAAFCQDRAYSFYGRKETLNMIKKYVRSNARHPLVIYGAAGCGKTSLLCKAAMDTHDWLADKNPAVIARMIGMTSSSANIRLLLRYILQQLCKLIGEEETCIPSDYKSLANQLCHYMSRAAKDRPLVLFLGSLHKLSDEHSARQLTWLPKSLPKNVKLIVSTDTDNKYDCFARLQGALEDNQQCFLELPPLSPKDAHILLGEWFGSTTRTITTEQKQFIFDCFRKCPQPLYLRVLFNESQKWSAHFDVRKLKFGNNCRVIAQTVYARLEKEHGEPLVRRALGYVTAARNGVASSEMEDLLSLDDVALTEVSLFCHPPMRRIPPLIWLRLKHDLEPLIEESESDWTMTMRWRHTPFYEAAVDRYLNSRDKAPSYHKPLAEYFLNMWYTNKKPFAGCEEGELRYVMEQGVYLTPHVGDVSHTSSLKRSFNYRALNELPYHLLKSAQADKMKAKCLCNFDFLLAKISACSLRAFFEDLQMALAADPNDKDIRLLSDTLQLSVRTLAYDTNQLPSQVIARLHDVIKKDVPVAPHDPVNYPFLKPFMVQAFKATQPALVPTRTCLTSPGGMLFDLLSGHSEPMTAVTLSPEGNTVVTTSHDNTLKLWDQKTGIVRKTISDVGKGVYQVRIGAKNKVIVTSETSCLRFWNAKTGVCLKAVKTDDPCSITTSCDTMCLTAFGHGSNVMTTYDLNSFKEVTKVNVREKKNSMIHQDESIIVAQTFPIISTSVLYAFRSQSEAVVRSATSGNVIHRLTCTEGASIQALGCTQAYYICAARFKYQKSQEVFYLEYFNVGTGKFQKNARGCTRDVNIRELMVNTGGSHALALCPSPDTNTCNIAVWNIATDDHKHVVEHQNISTFGAYVDLQYCLTASPNENSLRVWNLSGQVGKQAPKDKPNTGIESIIPIPQNDNNVITKSSKSGAISVWNISQEKETYVERGLVEKSDVVLVRNMTVVILTDKALVGDDSQPVFQSIHCYDLEKKKYTHQLKDCFIFPSPAHEYVLLDDDHLLGLSEVRSHFVIWNLTSGQIVHRMKTNFREKYKHHHEEIEVVPKDRQTTARMLPWKRRMETQTARKRRKMGEIEEAKEDMEMFRKEKENSIDMYLISADLRVIVASFYARHICVFDVGQRKHVHTLENFNSLLLLFVSVLSPNGSHLVHTHYDEDAKISYVTMWNCKTGEIHKRIKNEKDVCCVAMTDDSSTVVLGKSNGELRIWQPNAVQKSLRKLHAHKLLRFDTDTKIYLTDNSSKAVLFSGSVSMWDLRRESILAIFTPDTPIECVHVTHSGHTILLGLRHTSELVTLRPKSITMDTEPPKGAIDSHSAFEEEDEDENSEEQNEKDE